MIHFKKRKYRKPPPVKKEKLFKNKDLIKLTSNAKDDGKFFRKYKNQQIKNKQLGQIDEDLKPFVEFAMTEIDEKNFNVVNQMFLEEHKGIPIGEKQVLENTILKA